MKRSGALAGLLALTAVAFAADSGTEAPLLDLHLPVFNESGYRLWYLHADSMRQLTERPERFELSTVHLLVYDGDSSDTVRAEIFAPSAVYDQPNKTVSGKGQLHVIGRGVELFGHDWICYAETKSIVIERDVVVTFSADLGNVLR
jgi:hypothetical protein